MTTRRARKRPAESLCQPPFLLDRGKEATTFAPRPRALNRPVLPPSRPLAEPIRLGSPPALRTAIWTCLRNCCVRGLMRAPPLRDRPGLTLKFSLSSRAMTRRMTPKRAHTRAAEHRSRQIALTRMMAKKQRGSSTTHIAIAIAWKIEMHQKSSKGDTCTPCTVPFRRRGNLQKPMCRQPFATRGSPRTPVRFILPSFIRGKFAISIEFVSFPEPCFARQRDCDSSAYRSLTDASFYCCRLLRAC